MPWSCGLIENLSIVECVYSGIVTPAELELGTRSMLDQLRSHNASLILADCTLLEGGHSVADLYFLADLVQAEGGARSFKEAVLLPIAPAWSHLVRFWESTAFNRGLWVEVFDSRDRAIAWLLNPAGTP